MIRVVLFLIVVGALAVGVAWFADRPGDVVVTWQGLRIETSLMVLGAALLVAMAVVALIWSGLRAIVRSPTLVARLLRHRRGVRAYEAISSGLIAVGAGNVVAARKLAAEVNRIAPHEPLSLLLSAQAAQLAGDLEAAERTFHTMASRADTKTLGLHGLFIEARRRNDLTKARAFAEEAARSSPALGWAGRAVLEFRCAAGDWAGALALLERNIAAHAKASYRRQRAILLTARALAAEETDRDSAKSFALEANKLAPGLVPAAALAARLLAEAGQLRKASRIIDKAWAANPHPELAQAHMELRSGDSARDRLKRIEALAKKVPGHIEGALAVARAALHAQEFAKARAAVAPYLQAPTKRIALLMAELERAEKNDVGRAREWVARALHAAPDPAWTADGHVSDSWLPASPVTGRLDALEWRVPLSGTLSAPLIEPEPPAIPSAEITTEPPREIEPAAAATEPPPSEPSTVQTQPLPEIKLEPKIALKAEPKVEPIIPLVHAPDDPGPDLVEESDAPAERDGGWRKIFG
jgi:HemY protein